MDNVPAALGMKSGFDVDASALHQAGALLRSEADRLDAVLVTSGADDFRPCGGDPASEAAAAGILENYGSLNNAYRAHINELKRQADELASSARQYGDGDDGVRRGFTPS